LELSENAVPVKIIESFTKEGIKEACDKWKIKRDDVVLLKNSEGGGSQTASMIIKLGVKAVITLDKISDPAENIFVENMIPLVPSSSVEMTSMSEFSIVNSKALNKEIGRWIEVVTNQKKKEDKKKLLKLVDEYRAQRRRSPDK
jgi:predicted RNase H-like nuclease (RuvC/YqgF family)